LRDRLTVARDLLSESGSIFVQIGDENVHRVRALLDEVFGEQNCIALITVTKTTSSTNVYLAGVADYVLFYGKDFERTKYRPLFHSKEAGGDGASHYNMIVDEKGFRRSATPEERAGLLGDGLSLFTASDLQSAGMGRQKGEGAASWFEVEAEGKRFRPTMQTRWKTNEEGMRRLGLAGRLVPQKNALRYMRRINDFSAYAVSNVWTDLGGATDKRYVVETSPQLVQRCLLMASDPGDLVLDPTCGSGTTAYVAEEWGRRWITIDTSRVALALSRARIMGARYPYYLLADSVAGKEKEGEITHSAPSTAPSQGNIRHGFVYQRVPHISLKDITGNAELAVISQRYEPSMDTLRESINKCRGLELEEWQMPAEAGDPWPRTARKQHERFMRVTTDATKQKAVNQINKILGRQYTIDTVPTDPVDPWEDEELIDLHRNWWELKIERQAEIDASIAAKAEFEYLYDKPYEDNKVVRVAGPFTVESLSPHRVLGVGEDDELIDPLQIKEGTDEYDNVPTFEQMVLENLRSAGVQQAHKQDKIDFTSLTGWPGRYICAEGRYEEGETEKRAGIFLGPEFGTVSRTDLVEAVREAGDAGFDVLIACAFNYEAHASDLDQLGRVRILKARMNADLHMADELKNTNTANLFVIFGEPDIDVIEANDDQLMVKINGVDVFDPSTGEVRSDDADGIACWFTDTDYNGESFFVRQAYFLGANDPYKALKTTLKSEIDEAAWDSLYSDTSRPFPKPSTGRIAVKVINHLGDEVMKVFRV